MDYSSKRPTAKKPRKDFPLFPHARGYWAKKVRRKLCYFGKVEGDPKGQAALARWLEVKDDLLAGRVPRAKRDGLTIADLANQFLGAKERRVDSGERSARTLYDYKQSCARLVKYFGRDRLVEDIHPTEFEKLRADIAKTRGLVALGNEVQRIRSIFLYASKSKLTPAPIELGPEFVKPDQRDITKRREEIGPRLFSAADLKAILAKASPALKAMTLLGINAGLGNNDCSQLTFARLDLDTGWLNFPRPKTGVTRRCPLWPETIEAIRDYLKVRKAPKLAEHNERVFITYKLGSFARELGGGSITHEFSKLLDSTGIKRKKGTGFYTLRHVFRTVADEARDQPAADLIMGHKNEHISSHYRERIDDSRLLAVSNYVREWLFGKEGETNGQA
jgi:integrase